MKKNLINLAVVLFLVFLLQGCETCKGTAKGFSEGFKKDWQEVPKTDSWIKEHLW